MKTPKQIDCVNTGLPYLVGVCINFDAREYSIYVSGKLLKSWLFDKPCDKYISVTETVAKQFPEYESMLNSLIEQGVLVREGAGEIEADEDTLQALKEMADAYSGIDEGFDLDRTSIEPSEIVSVSLSTSPKQSPDNQEACLTLAYDLPGLESEILDLYYYCRGNKVLTLGFYDNLIVIESNRMLTQEDIADLVAPVTWGE